MHLGHVVVGHNRGLGRAGNEDHPTFGLKEKELCNSPVPLSWRGTNHARHAVDDSNTRQGTTSLEDIWGTKDWKCWVFAFFLGVVEANVRNAHDKPAGSRLSLAEIRLDLVKEIVGKYALLMSSKRSSGD